MPAKVSINFFYPKMEYGNFIKNQINHSMKNLFYSTAIVLAMSSFAYAGSSITFADGSEVLQEKEYKKIKPEEVSKEALANIKTNYGNYQISEAAVSSDGEYKLTLKKDDALLVATFTAAGDLIKIL